MVATTILLSCAAAGLFLVLLILVIAFVRGNRGAGEGAVVAGAGVAFFMFLAAVTTPQAPKPVAMRIIDECRADRDCDLDQVIIRLVEEGLINGQEGE